MKIVSPWVPAFNGKLIPPLKRLVPILANDESPTSKHSPLWTRSLVRKRAGSDPEAEEPLWETVLALWRLSQVECCDTDDGEDDLWTQHVRAWLVRRARVSGGNAG